MSDTLGVCWALQLKHKTVDTSPPCHVDQSCEAGKILTSEGNGSAQNTFPCYRQLRESGLCHSCLETAAPRCECVCVCEQLCEWADMELANTCNEGDKSGAKCFVQLQVRCELTQDVKWRKGKKEEGRQHKATRGHFRLLCCLQLVEVSYAERLQGAGRQWGSWPMSMSACNHQSKMEWTATLSNIVHISSRVPKLSPSTQSLICLFDVLEQRWY